jgi:hypothetical protein
MGKLVETRLARLVIPTALLDLFGLALYSPLDFESTRVFAKSFRKSIEQQKITPPLSTPSSYPPASDSCLTLLITPSHFGLPNVVEVRKAGELVLIFFPHKIIHNVEQIRIQSRHFILDTDEEIWKPLKLISVY